MFNLNESNRFVMSRNPVDLRKGVDSLCGAIRSCHLDPLNGDVYVFSNRSRTVLKLLHWERGGYTLYSNHPKSAVFFDFQEVPTFVLKKVMFNLNESNRFVMSRNPVDLRKGVDSLCGAIRSCHLDPLNGDVYVFSNRSRTVLKLLHWERGGYTLYYKRLSMGRFHPKIFLRKIFLREGIGFRSMRWDELVLLMEGISPEASRRKRLQAVSPSPPDGGSEKSPSSSQNTCIKSWLSR